MTKLVQILFLSMVVLVSSVSGEQLEPGKQPLRVSMFQLLANPERYNGHVIRVVGFLTLGREADYIYPYETDAIHLLMSNRLGIDRTEQMGKVAPTLKGKYVRLVGRFRKAADDQLILGTITEITSCEVWSDPAEPISRKLGKMSGVHSDAQ